MSGVAPLVVPEPPELQLAAEEGLSGCCDVLLLVRHSKEGDVVPEAVAEAMARDRFYRAIGALDQVQHVGADSRRGLLHNCKVRACNIVDAVGWCVRRLDRHLRLLGEGALPILPSRGDEKGCDRYEQRVVLDGPVLRLHLQLEDNFAVLRPIGVVAQLCRRQVAVALDLSLARLDAVVAMRHPALKDLLARIEQLGDRARHRVAQIALIAVVVARLDDIPAELLLPQRRDVIAHGFALPTLVERHHLGAQPSRPEATKRAAHALAIQARLRGVVAQALGADK